LENRVQNEDGGETMKLYLKQRVFSWSDRFYVKDEQGNDRYSVAGELFSWGKKLHIYDAGGSEVAFIRQKLFTWLPRFYVEIDGRVVCEIVKEFTFFKPSYRIEGLNWRMDGDFFSHEYCLYDGGREIMRLSKHWFTWGDSYELAVANPMDELLCLSVALAMDCAVAAQSD